MEFKVGDEVIILNGPMGLEDAPHHKCYINTIGVIQLIDSDGEGMDILRHDASRYWYDERNIEPSFKFKNQKKIKDFLNE